MMTWRMGNGWRLRIASLALTVGVVGVPVGCTSALGDAEEASTEPAASPGEARFESTLATLLGELDLTPSQRASVDAILADVTREAEPIHAEKAAAAEVLAEGVRRGRIDRGAFDDRVAAVKLALESKKPALQALANRLHATLTPDQREALVDGLRDRLGGAREHRRERMQELADRLGLTEAQRDRLKDTFRTELAGRRGEMRARMEEARDRVDEVVEAFESDDFDAIAMDLGGPAIARVDDMAEAILRMTELALPVLDESQRQELSRIIEERVDGDPRRSRE